MNKNELMTGVKVKNRRRARTVAASTSNVGAERVALTVIGGASLTIGLWAVACLVSVMIQNGPLGLVTGWLGAVTGV